MPYRDRLKQKEVQKERQRRYRARAKGVTEGVTEIAEGVTSLNTPGAVKAAMEDWTPLIDEHGHADPVRLAAHRAKIIKDWSRPGDYAKAWRMLADSMGWSG